MNIVYHRSFFSYDTNFRDILADLKKIKIDAIFLSAKPLAAGELIKQAHEMGIDAPLVGNDALASKSLWETVGKLAENLVVPTVFNPAVNLSKAFIEKFKAKYEYEPDPRAALGYDSIHLLAYAMKEAQSSVPIVVATKLRYMKPWIGITGIHQFQENGEIKGKKYFFQKLRADGELEFIPNAHLDYIFELLDKR
jgi:ABC-type branched-subunit amino acid transport system substrate-binding protein